MARKNDKKLEDNVESLLEMMQEVFHDCDEQKTVINKSIKERNDRFAPTDIEDMCNMGRLENDSMRLLNEILDKKTKLLQIQAKLVTSKQMIKPSDEDDEDSVKLGLSELELSEIRLLADQNKTKNQYDLSSLDKK